ncbi:DinB family protein [Flavihumibacter sp. ZG627]|uniref:DinB family protein n=1 Tax=Flavihumibacter sp. ZG627 TaxID=1463156 RepID=UPI00057CA878|nr:DinB family protein [Flavihumibacter sp. ZG627]KIC89295.1 hypothetical protein HY58_16865 [Flavihumibacter sp. ZG627]
MKQLLQDYATYHHWANQLLGQKIAEQDSALWTREIPVSFPSLHKTLTHIWDADRAWWNRLKKEPDTGPFPAFEGDIAEALGQLLVQNEQLIKWIADQEESQLNATLKYVNWKGIPFEQPIAHVLLHIFSHGSYHRGQLVNMLRALGVENIPQTDFIVWARMK